MTCDKNDPCHDSHHDPHPHDPHDQLHNHHDPHDQLHDHHSHHDEDHGGLTCHEHPHDSHPCPCDPYTYCNRDRKNNVWVEGNDPETGEGGICLLDTITEEQLIFILERDEVARKDLLRVTSDPYLLDKAATTQRLTTDIEGDVEQKAFNANTLPFYTAFHGNFPFPQ